MVFSLKIRRKAMDYKEYKGQEAVTVVTRLIKYSYDGKLHIVSYKILNRNEVRLFAPEQTNFVLPYSMVQKYLQNNKLAGSCVEELASGIKKFSVKHHIAEPSDNDKPKNKPSTKNKEIITIEILDYDSVEVLLSDSSSFEAPVKNMKSWVLNNCKDAEKWVDLMKQKLDVFEPILSPSEESQITEPEPDETTQTEKVENVYTEPEIEEIEYPIIPSVFLVESLTSFGHPHKAYSRKVYIAIENQETDEENKILFPARYCPKCENYYIEKEKYIQELARITPSYFNCSVQDLTVTGKRPVQDNTSSEESEHNFIPPEERILVVRKNLWKCFNKGHHIQSQLYDIPIINILGQFDYVRVEIQYCSQCRRYSIYEDVFNFKIKRYNSQNVLKTFEYGNKLWGLVCLNNFQNPESPLKQSGYTVNQTDNLSEYTRHAVLSHVIECGILSLEHVKGYLKYFMRTLGSLPNNQLAYSKWESDYEWLEEQYPSEYKGRWKGKLGWR